MSSALLKRSTEILYEDLISSDKKSTVSQRQSANKNDRIFKLKSNKSRKERNQSVLDGNKLCNENIKKLLDLSGSSLQIAAAEKIVKRAHKGRYTEDTVPKVQQQQESIFTEEDFAAFGKEYLC